MNKINSAESHRLLIRQLEFDLYKAEHGMGMPYSYEDVAHYRRLLAEAKAAAPDSADVKLAALLQEAVS